MSLGGGASVVCGLNHRSIGRTKHSTMMIPTAKSDLCLLLLFLFLLLFRISRFFFHLSIAQTCLSFVAIHLSVCSYSSSLSVSLSVSLSHLLHPLSMSFYRTLAISVILIIIQSPSPTLPPSCISLKLFNLSRWNSGD